MEEDCVTLARATTVFDRKNGMSARMKHQTIVAVFALILITPVLVADTHASETRPLKLAGTFPGMQLHAFRMLHDNATITRKTAVRYCYGQPIVLKDHARVEAVVALGRATLKVKFKRHGAGYQISAIELREQISPRPEQIRKIRDGFMRKFGPISEILRRRKMEPAGLIVGFQWNVPGVAVLTAKVHRDHAEDPERFYLTSILVKPATEIRTSQHAGMRYRNVIREFRDRCFRAGKSAMAQATKETISHEER